MFAAIHFANPGFLYLFILVPGIIVWYWYKHREQHAELTLSTAEAFKHVHTTKKQHLFHVLFGLRVFAIMLLIIALARPQTNMSRQDVSVEGIDIVMAMDISGSMLAEDFKPNRLEAAKEEAMKFIDGRPNDRIGMVVFSGESFTQCPLTTDRAVLKTMMMKIKSGMIDDGTALGDGLATAVNRLRKSKAVSKVIILLTDGINNMGSVDPLSAAEIAKVFGVRVYTVGVGTMGMAPYPFQTPYGIQYQNIEVKIDEQLLKQIAQMTNGKYFRATNKQKLEDIYKEIDRLEKSKIDVTEFRRKKEEFWPFALMALVIIVLEFITRKTILRSIP